MWCGACEQVACCRHTGTCYLQWRDDANGKVGGMTVPFKERRQAMTGILELIQIQRNVRKVKSYRK